MTHLSFSALSGVVAVVGITIILGNVVVRRADGDG